MARSYLCLCALGAAPICSPWMITAAIAAIERLRDRCLPGKEHVITAEAWSALTRIRTARRVIHDRRHRAAILVRPPVVRPSRSDGA
ncbi:MAG: hypothetical protein ACLPXW_11425 [Xanthobacteraceae bacterium]